MKHWKVIDRSRPLPYPTVRCFVCKGLGWTEAPGSCAADGLQSQTCTYCRGEGRVPKTEYHSCGAKLIRDANVTIMGDLIGWVCRNCGGAVQ